MNSYVNNKHILIKYLFHTEKGMMLIQPQSLATWATALTRGKGKKGGRELILNTTWYTLTRVPKNMILPALAPILKFLDIGFLKALRNTTVLLDSWYDKSVQRGKTLALWKFYVFCYPTQ